MTNKLPAIQKIANASVLVFVALFPIYFSPLTFDMYELNKSLLIVVFGMWFLILLALQSLAQKSFKITTSYLSLPLVLLGIAYILAGIFTISNQYSFWGFYGYLSNSLPVILFAISLTFTIPTLVSSKKQAKNIYTAFLVSILFVLVTSLVAYFAVIPLNSRIGAFLSNINFNLTGGINSLRYLVLYSSFLFSFGVIRSKTTVLQSINLLGLVVALLLAGLILKPLFLAFVVVVTLLPAFIYKKALKSNKLYYFISALVVLGLSIVVSTVPQVKEALGLRASVPTLPSLGFGESWEVTRRAFTGNALFGTGPSTFINSFTRFKPAELNNTVFWDTLFIKPKSYYMMVIVEAGLLGIISFLYLLFRVFKKALSPQSLKQAFSKELPSDATILKLTLVLVLLSLFTTSTGAFLFGFLFIVISLFLTFEKFNDNSGVDDLTLSVTGESNKNKGKTSSLITGVEKVFSLHILFSLIVAVVLTFTGAFVARVFLGDYFFYSPFNRPQTVIDLRNNYSKAINANRNNDFYIRSMIQADKRLARVLAQQINNANEDNLNEEQLNVLANQITNTLRLAARRSDAITTGGFAVNVQNWEEKALLYQNTIGTVDRAGITAVESYATASALNPLNPRIPASIGSVYYALENYQQAATFFNRAILLKNNYAVPRYNLAKTFEQVRQYENALAVAETLLDILPQDSQDVELVNTYIEQLKDLVAQNPTEEQADIDVQAPIEGEEELAGDNQPGLTEPGDAPARAGQEGSAAGTPTNANQNQTNDIPALPNQQPNTQPGEGFIETPAGEEEEVSATPTPAATPTPNEQ